MTGLATSSAGRALVPSSTGRSVLPPEAIPQPSPGSPAYPSDTFTLANPAEATPPTSSRTARSIALLPTLVLLTRVIIFINPTRLGREFPTAQLGKTEGEALLVAPSKLSSLASRTPLIVPEIARRFQGPRASNDAMRRTWPRGSAQADSCFWVGGSGTVPDCGPRVNPVKVRRGQPHLAQVGSTRAGPHPIGRGSPARAPTFGAGGPRLHQCLNNPSILLYIHKLTRYFRSGPQGIGADDDVWVFRHAERMSGILG